MLLRSGMPTYLVAAGEHAAGLRTTRCRAASSGDGPAVACAAGLTGQTRAGYRTKNQYP